MCADTIFTYIQDKMGMTHYLFFVGGNNCGQVQQSSGLEILGVQKLYIYRHDSCQYLPVLRKREEGQGTICEDEADRIDDDRQKMAIHKNGYIKGIPVARTDTSFGTKQMKFNTYCFKAFALKDSQTQQRPKVLTRG